MDGGAMSWAVMAAVATVAGWLTGVLMRGRGYGLVPDLVLGLLGGLVGHVLLQIVHGTAVPGSAPALLFTLMGAMLLVALVRLIRR